MTTKLPALFTVETMDGAITHDGVLFPHDRVAVFSRADRTVRRYGSWTECMRAHPATFVKFEHPEERIVVGRARASVSEPIHLQVGWDEIGATSAEARIAALEDRVEGLDLQFTGRLERSMLIRDIEDRQTRNLVEAINGILGRLEKLEGLP